MESFVLRPMTWPAFLVLSRNPLVRASDRIESVVLTLGAVAIVVVTACAGVLGTLVYSAHTQTYAEQAKTRHAVVAIAAEDSKTAVTAQAVFNTVYARWQLNGTDDDAEILYDKPVKAGEPVQIWVDNEGNRVSPPVPVRRAATDAVTVAIVVWLSVVLAITSGVSTVRANTGRMRNAQWDREIRCLVDDDGGYTNRKH